MKFAVNLSPSLSAGGRRYVAEYATDAAGASHVTRTEVDPRYCAHWSTFEQALAVAAAIRGWGGAARVEDVTNICYCADAVSAGELEQNSTESC